MQFIKQIGVTELALGLTILLVPFLPSNILAIFDLIAVRFLVVVALLFAITQNYLIGILAFVLVGVLYLERNRRKIAMARVRFSEMVDSKSRQEMTVEEESQSQQTVPVREFEVPDDRIVYYSPNPSCATNSNEFVPASGAESLNAKVVFNAVPGGATAGSLFEREGFGHIGIN